MKKESIKIILAFVIFIIGLVNPFNNEWISKGIYLVSYLIVGFEVLKKAIKNILKGEVFDECFLMSIATIGAFFVGEFPEAVCVMLFYQIGEFFQDYAVDKSKKSISDLMDIRPDYANVLREGNENQVSPDEVKKGEVIIIKPGEKVPLDGIVIEGKSSIDTTALTGESIPRRAEVNDEVFSGSINKEGILKVKVKNEFEESTVSKILDLIENASNRKSKSENFITKFAKYYTPAVVIIAFLLAIFPPLIFKGATFSEWIYRALSFLVVSCPCALVMSVPLSFFGGIGGASKIGILIKGTNYLEALSNAGVVVFDKTGTLTEGVFDVQKINPVGMSKKELFKIAVEAEYYSNHPISQSIKKAHNIKIDEKDITESKEISGLGIIAKIRGKSVLAGNEKLMADNGIKFEKCSELGTVIYVAIDNVYAGNIVIADKIKKDSKIAIDNLKDEGIKQTVMLTGDKKKIGEFVAEKLGIDKVFTELMPDEKVTEVEKLMENNDENGKLVFVGDGINDAPVLAISDIGIAMGGLGSDAAIEAADVVIMTDEPSKVAEAVKISKKNMRIVKENIYFSIFVKVAVLILSTIGISTLWEAVFADVGVTFIAVLNSLRMFFGISHKTNLTN